MRRYRVHVTVSLWLFSVLRRIKTHLRSTMTDERLTGLTMMFIHHAECLSLQTETVVRRFVQDKPIGVFFANLMSQTIR